ncbi:MAG: hypothetical protein Q8R11_01715 [bacterium]|nr:hypothetical protein [bacterium]
MVKQSQQKTTMMSRVAPKRVLDQNAGAMKSYDNYRKAADIIERAEFAAGKRVIFKSGIGSTLNFEINRYGISSTTAQKI